MRSDLVTYRAVLRAEEGIGDGYGVRYAVASAAESLAVDVAEVALLVLEKLIECGRARAAVTSMQEADADIEAGTHTAIAPHAHRVPGRRRAA